MIINNRIFRISACLIILLLGVSLLPTSVADDSITIPRIFKGGISLNDNAAPEGTEIKAFIGVRAAGSTCVTESGTYSIAVSGYPDEDGSQITFMVNNITAQETATYYYVMDSSGHRDLDLAFRGGSDFLAPGLSSPSAFPRSILNDGTDTSNISVFVVDGTFAVKSVTLYISPLFGAAAPMSLTGDNMYISNVNSTLSGIFTLTIIATDFADNSVSTPVILEVLDTETAIGRYDTVMDGTISKAEALPAVNAYLDGNISRNILYSVVKAYYAPGQWAVDWEEIE